MSGFRTKDTMVIFEAFEYAMIWYDHQMATGSNDHILQLERYLSREIHRDIHIYKR